MASIQSLAEMFPNATQLRLQTALENAGGDVALAAESLLPPDMQIQRDEALARSLQAAEIPNGAHNGNMGNNMGEESWSQMAQPVLDGISYVAESAKNAVQYVAAELIAAASLGDEEEVGGVGRMSSMNSMNSMSSPSVREETATVVTGGAMASRGDASGVHMRPNRSGRSSSRVGGGAPKKDD